MGYIVSMEAWSREKSLNPAGNRKHSLIRPDCSQVTNQMSTYKEVTAVNTRGARDGVSGGHHSLYLLLYSPSAAFAHGQFFCS